MRGGDCRRGLILLVCMSPRILRRAMGEDEDAHAMLFSGRDIWLNGAFAYGGFLFAPSGLDQDGLLLKILLSGGLYRYDATKPRRRHASSAPKDWRKFLPGWRIKRGDAEFKFFMGPEIQKSSSPAGRSGKSIAWHSRSACAWRRDLVRADDRHDDRGGRFTVVDRNQQLGARRLRLARVRGDARRRLRRPGNPIFRFGRLPAFASRRCTSPA